MTLYEFNNLDLDAKYYYLFPGRGSNDVKLVSLREDGDKKYMLWAYNYFFVEYCSENGGIVSIEAIESDDDRINLYIDYFQEHKDDPKYQID